MDLAQLLGSTLNLVDVYENVIAEIYVKSRHGGSPATIGWFLSLLKWETGVN